MFISSFMFQKTVMKFSSQKKRGKKLNQKIQKLKTTQITHLMIILKHYPILVGAKNSYVLITSKSSY